MRFTIPSLETSTASDYFNQFGNWLNTSTQTIKDKTTSLYNGWWDNYYSTVLSKPVNQSQEDFFLKAQQDADYKAYRQWSSVMAQEIRQLKGELLENTKRPADLRAYLATQLQQVPASLISPLFYQRILAKLNTQLAEPSLISYYRVIIEEAEENLQKVLQEQPEAVLNCFYKDVKNHLVEIAGGRYSAEELLEQLAFYQGLVPNKVYQLVRRVVEKNFATEINYKSCMQKLERLAFEEEIAEENNATEITSSHESTSPNFFSRPGVAVTTAVAASAVALGLYATAKADSTNSFSLSQSINYFNLPEFHQINLVPPAYVVTSVIFYYGTERSFQGLTPSYNTFSLGLLSSLSTLATSDAQTTSGSLQNSTFFMAFGGTYNEEGQGITTVPTDGSLAVAGYTVSYGVGTDGYRYNAYVAKIQTNGNLEWLNVLQSFYSSYGSRIVALADGSLVFSGFIIGPQATGIDYFVAKIAANGTLVWTRSLGGYNNEQGGGIIALADGSTIVCGYDTSFGAGNEVFIAKIGTNGSLMWARDLGGAALDTASDITQVLTDGSLGMVGDTSSFGATRDILVTKLNANGTLIWATTFSSSNNDYGIGITALPDTSLVITGSTINAGTGNSDIVVVKLLANNTLAWMRTLGGFNNFHVSGYSLAALADGNLALVGVKTNVVTSNQEIIVAKIQANGVLQWAHFLGGYRDINSGYSIKELADGSLVLTGRHIANYATNSNNDILVTKLTSDGLLTDCAIPQTTLWPSNTTSLWQAANLNVTDVTALVTQRDLTTRSDFKFQNPISNITSVFIKPSSTTLLCPVTATPSFFSTYNGDISYFPRAVSANYDDSIVMTGGMANSTNINTDVSRFSSEGLLLTKMDANGTLIWSKRLGGSGSDVAANLYPTADGGNIVAGHTTSFGLGYADALLVKVSSNGTVVWAYTVGSGADEEIINASPTSDDGTLFTGLLGYGGYDALYFKVYNTGTLAWAYKIAGGDKGIAIYATTEGGAVIGGFTSRFGSGNADALLAKVNSNGNPVWAFAFGGAGVDYTSAVYPATNGDIMAVGYTSSFAGGRYEAFLANMNRNSGAINWAYRLGGNNATYQAYNNAYLTPQGDSIFAGLYQAFNSADIFLAKVSSNGTLIWAYKLGGNGTDYGLSVSPSLDNSILLTGYTNSFRTPYVSALLAKLDANGNFPNCQEIERIHPVWQSFTPNITAISPSAFLSLNLTVQNWFNISTQPISFSRGASCTPISYVSTMFNTAATSMQASSHATTTEAASPSSTTPGVNIPVLAGSIAGGVGALIVTFGGIVVFCWYRKHKQVVPSNRSSSEEELTLPVKPSPVSPNSPGTAAVELNLIPPTPKKNKESQIITIPARSGDHTYKIKLTPEELNTFNKKIPLKSEEDRDGYHIVGKGHFGKAYKALAIHLGNKPVIVKENTNADSAAIEAAENEAKLQSELGQLGYLMPILDYKLMGKKLLIIMQAALFSGRDFQKIYSRLAEEQLFPEDDKFFHKNRPDEVKDLARNMTRLRQEIIFHMAMDLLHALSNLQEKTVPVIHHDIKPDNILFQENGEADLADFGCARKQKGKITEHITADVRYKSGEQLEVERKELADYQGEGRDVHALGLTLLEMLVGEFPLDTASAREIIHWSRKEFTEQRDKFTQKYGNKLQAGMMELILKMTHPKPEKRPTPKEALGQNVFSAHHENCTFFTIRKKVYKRMASLPTPRLLAPEQTVIDGGYEEEGSNSPLPQQAHHYLAERNPEHYLHSKNSQAFFGNKGDRVKVNASEVPDSYLGEAKPAYSRSPQ